MSVVVRGLVLAYHAQNCGGFEYADNDHIAFAADLVAIARRQLPLVPLGSVASALAEGAVEKLPPRFVALSCDDGTLLDWRDYEHPEFGLQRALANILRDHLAGSSQDTRGLLTAFVIASAEARRAIDAGCYGGIPLSDDDWWAEAAREGLVSIQNHSWDHLHEVLPAELIAQGRVGDFYSVDTLAAADRQVRQAGEAIRERLGAYAPAEHLFAYPYGHAGDYLCADYLPAREQEHGVLAAFTTEQGFVEADSPRYRLPRMVCGDAWSSPAQFEALLDTLQQA